MVTDTVGGAMSGYCSTGSDVRPMTPATTIRILITELSTGLLINVLSCIAVSYFIESAEDISESLGVVITGINFILLLIFLTPSMAIVSPSLSPSNTK